MHSFKTISDILKGKQIKYFSGKLALMCPTCYNIKYVDINMNILINKKDIFCCVNYISSCDNCNFEGAFIELDPNIAECISILNKKGYRTMFCCEGHDDSQAYIYFNTLYENAIMKFVNNIDKLYNSSWYIDKKDWANGKLILRVNEGSKKTKYIKELKDFVDELPDIRSNGYNSTYVSISDNGIV